MQGCRRWGLALGALVAAMLVVGAITPVGRASAEPPQWWFGLTGAGPPNYVPNFGEKKNREPPFDEIGSTKKQITDFFENELKINTAEIVVLRRDLDPSKHIGSLSTSALQTLLTGLFFAGAPECGFPLALIKLHAFLEMVIADDQKLNLAQKYLRLKADEQYVEWLDRWYVRYDPNYKNTWQNSPRWKNNPKSPFNMWIRENRRLLSVFRGLQKSRGKRIASMAMEKLACPPTVTPSPPPTSPPKTPPTSPPTTPPTSPPSSVRVQVDMYRMVFNDGTVQGAGTVTSDPAGISCSVSRDFAATAPAVTGTCAASFPGGTHLTLMATPESQTSVFQGWSNAAGLQATADDPCFVQGTGPCALTLGASGGYEIGASFGLQTRVLTIDNPDQTHGEILVTAPTGGQQAICGVEDERCSVVYPFGQPVTVDANGQDPPITGYGLQGCDASYPGTTPCQVTMTADKTVAVNWIEQGG